MIVLLLTAFALTGPHARGADWPQFRGPNRDGKSPETGLLKEWPEGGPPLLWKADGLGRGWTSAIVADDTIFTTGTQGETDHLFALDADGALLWKALIGRAWLKGWPGTRSNPTVDGDRIYVVSGQCEVVCLSRKDGARIWSVDTQEKFGTVMLSYWGNAESPLVAEGKVIFTPGAPEAGIVALDKMTGETVWICRELSHESADCSPILVERGGLRLVVTLTAKALVGVDLETGELLWTYPRRVQHGVNATSPAYDDGCIYTTSGYGGALPEDMPEGTSPKTRDLPRLLACEMLRLSEDGRSIKPVWGNNALDVQHGGVVIHNGIVYGASGVQRRGKWVCQDLQTGEVLAEIPGVGKGSLAMADGMIYAYGELGQVGLIKADPDDFRLISSFRIPDTFEDRRQHWAHPVVAGGRLYIRYSGSLRAYDIRDR